MFFISCLDIDILAEGRTDLSADQVYAVVRLFPGWKGISPDPGAG
jgi:hypothetical protein